MQGKEGHQAWFSSSQLLLPLFSGVSEDTPSSMFRVDSKVQPLGPPPAHTHPHLTFVFMFHHPPSCLMNWCAGHLHHILSHCPCIATCPTVTTSSRVQNALLCFGVANQGGDNARAGGKCPATCARGRTVKPCTATGFSHARPLSYTHIPL